CDECNEVWSKIIEANKGRLDAKAIAQQLRDLADSIDPDNADKAEPVAVIHYGVSFPEDLPKDLPKVGSTITHTTLTTPEYVRPRYMAPRKDKL
ncbi:MAG: hypothetical protein MJE68_11545, partial [Proteobacteria bacterium]|nr:hypothetical protein [Pseudomonadota bacterium]